MGYFTIITWLKIDGYSRAVSRYYKVPTFPRPFIFHCKMGMLLIYLAFLICIKQLGRFFHGIFQDNKNSTSAYDINNAYLMKKARVISLWLHEVISMCKFPFVNFAYGITIVYLLGFCRHINSIIFLDTESHRNYHKQMNKTKLFYSIAP